MKRIAFTGLVAITIALTVVSCQKTEKLNLSTNNQNLKVEEAHDTTHNDCGDEESHDPGGNGNTLDICNSITTELIAGQNIRVGTITIENNSDNLVVTYTTTGGWMIESTHLYAGHKGEAPTNNTGNPQVGLFPVYDTFDPMTNTVTYEIPVENMRKCLIVAAHADVSKVVNGEIVDSQTAWGEGTRFTEKGNWATYTEYCPELCPIIIGDLCYVKSIGWTDGTLYAPQSNCWGTYVTYSAGLTADLIADDTEVAGTVHFSAITNGEVTITISLNEGYIQNSDVKFTKIQGYDAAPTTKPHPLNFTTYQGKSLIVTVPAYNFYGVHLNLLRNVPCD